MLRRERAENAVELKDVWNYDKSQICIVKGNNQTQESVVEISAFFAVGLLPNALYNHCPDFHGFHFSILYFVKLFSYQLLNCLSGCSQWGTHVTLH